MNSPPTSVRSRDMRHRDWMTAAEEEYRRLGALLAELGDEDWQRPTDCDEWDVRQMVAHLVGAAEATASIRELARQARLGRRTRPGAPGVDGMNAVQVADRAEATPARLRADLADAGGRGVRARTRIPAPLRALPMPFGPPLGTRPLGYLMDRIYTRDAWLHRVDLARATGRPLLLTPDHDGRIVADVVAEWAGAHGEPYLLTLTGPAGGSWSSGADGEDITVDAVEFCRILSGRARGAGLLTRGVPF
ncbi:MAG: maleylpyruvate isomerase family mycothiol-dependent enzyme [Blastococcus sp.]